MDKRYTYTCEAAYKVSGEIDVPEGGNVQEAIKEVLREGYNGNNFTDILRLEVKEVPLDDLYLKFSKLVGFNVNKGDFVYVVPHDSFYILSGKVKDVEFDDSSRAQANPQWTKGLQISVEETKEDTWLYIDDNSFFPTLEQAQDKLLEVFIRDVPNSSKMSMDDIISKLLERMGK